jgi:iron(III) transport system substrate-binding protein
VGQSARLAWLGRRMGLLLLAGLVGACGPNSDPSGASKDAGVVHLYTSVTQDTVDAVLAAYAAAFPDVRVDVFRAASGELDARIASEHRSGRIGADVLWATDPLSVQAYAVDGLLRAWTPDEADTVPAAYHTDAAWGTRLLYMVIVAQQGASKVPADWSDLTEPAFADGVAIPDPSFAGSAFGALGYFATADDYGMDYYRSLKANGAVQLQAVTEVVTDVAEGTYLAGITLDKLARDAIALGSPLQLVWPASGAIAMYSPIAIFADAGDEAAAASFANFVLTRDGQAAIASTGWQPIREDVGGGSPVGGSSVSPDWELVFEQQDRLLSEYRSIFGG